MNLLGQAVCHKTFGNGIVTELDGNTVMIRFSECSRKFLYPDAFSSFLAFSDAAAQEEIAGAIRRQKHKELEKKRAVYKEQENQVKIRTMKILPNSQAAFNIDFGSSRQVFASGCVSTGNYLSGCSKGEVRVPLKLNPNSACLLTECSLDSPENERRVTGVFMVKNDFIGRKCTDGIIQFHNEYKLLLNEDCELRLWDYLDLNERVFSWGKTVFKYFSNLTMQQILFDINNLLGESDNKGKMDDFYQYFCEINRLPKIKTNI